MKTIHPIIIGVIIIASCSSPQPKQSEEQAATESEVLLNTEQMQNAHIQTGMIAMAAIKAEIPVTGMIDVPPQNLHSVSVPMAGYITQTDLLPGSKVKKGQTIAILEDQSYIQLQQDYLTAVAHLEYLKAEYDRQKELNASKATSDKNLQLARSEFETETIAVRSLGEKLKLINIQPEGLVASNISKSIRITSPCDGYVSAVHVNLGKYVMPTDVLFELVNPSDVHLNLNVFEHNLPDINFGQQVVAWTNRNPEKKYPAEIILIGQKFNESRSVEVHCHFEAFHPELVPGTFMNAVVIAEHLQLPSLPADAVVAWENGHYIFIDQGDGKFEMTPVTVKQETEQTIYFEPKNPEVLTKQVVTANAYALLMKLKNAAEEE